jgi:hypothetical protein
MSAIHEWFTNKRMPTRYSDIRGNIRGRLIGMSAIHEWGHEYTKGDPLFVYSCRYSWMVVRE